MKSETQTFSQLQLLLTSIREIDASLMQEQIPRKAILLMGQTKAGKTTLFYYLEGKGLIWEKNEIQVWQLRPQVNYMNAYIGNGYESTTVYPNIPSFKSQDDIMVIDMPGFDDDRFYYRLLNIYIILQTLRRIKQVHICHVIPEESCDGSSLIDEFTKITNLFNKQIIFSNNLLSFIISKVENQDIKDAFCTQIDDLIEQKIMEQKQDELRAFKLKNIFQFHNNQAKIEQGLLLRKRIQKENMFYDTHYQPLSLLSQNYSQEMIGRNNLQQFEGYLIQVIQNISNILQPLLRAYMNVTIFEFQTTLSLSQEEVIQIKQKIVTNTLAINLYSLQNYKFKASELFPLSADHFVILLKMFKTNSRQDKQYLIKTLEQFSMSISDLILNKTALEEQYLNTIKNCLHEMSKLIAIIMEVHLQQAKKKINNLIIDEHLLSIIDEFNSFLYSKKHLIISSKQFSLHSQHHDIIQLMKQLDIQTEEQQIIIQKVYHYSRPNLHKEICTIIKKHQSIITTNNLSIQGDNIDQLPISPQSLRYLKDMLQKSKQREAVKKILNKISQIFYWFSLFQEAIMFKMTIIDQEGIRSLIEQAVICNQMSKQFVREILIPYYCKINVDVLQLQICYTYLSCLSCSIEQKQSIQEQRMGSIDYIVSNPQNYYFLRDRYKPLEFYYINSILQNFEYYLQQIKIKQQQFNRSSVSALISFINQKMKQ